ncbi:MliC family protein [Novispirillum sp. DQ9]|uniref:MliC family protein n=1 Tax=Novispirillum sp. DQ9 TaxID=3398612 RepID=UPI003C7C72A4
MRAAALVLAAGLGACVPVLPPAAPDELGSTVYQCDDGTQVMARFSGDMAELWLPDGIRTMMAGRAASGVRYVDRDLVFWTKGLDQARLERPGATAASCTAGPPAPWRDAAAAGATFRAVGQEPGWLLDVLPDSLRLLADYATREVTVPKPAPRRAGDRTTYDAGRLRVDILAEPCRDIMSGQPFPATVRVTLDGTPWRGCGMELEAR